MEYRTNIYHSILSRVAGGPHVYVEYFMRHFPAQSNHIKILCNNKIKSGGIFNFRGRTKIFFPIEVIFNIFLLSIFIDRRSSVVFCHSIFNIAPVLYCLIFRVPMGIVIHETIPANFISRFYIRFILLFGGRVRIYSVSNLVIHRFNGIKIDFLPGCVDTKFWTPEVAVELKSTMNNDIFTVVCVGNLNPIKGYHVLLKSLAMLDFRVSVNIVGGAAPSYDDYGRKLKVLARSLPKTCSVNFLGQRNPEEILSIVGDADIFLMPSISEGAPLALLEAMSMGKICVASSVGDIPHILSSGTCGVLIETPITASSICASIRYAFNLTAVQKLDLGANARLRVLEAYSVEGFREKLETVHEDMCRLMS